MTVSPWRREMVEMGWHLGVIGLALPGSVRLLGRSRCLRCCTLGVLILGAAYHVHAQWR